MHCVKSVRIFGIYFVHISHNAGKYRPKKTPNTDTFHLHQARNKKEGGREISPTLFSKLKKSVLALEKNALNKFIYGLNFSFLI